MPAPSDREILSAELEIVRALRRIGAGEPIPWYYRSRLRFIGNIPMPEQRALFRRGFSFDDGDPRRMAAFWSRLWERTRYFEVMNQCLMFYQNRSVLGPSDWKVLKPWSGRIENWAHSDGLCSLYASLYESHPGAVRPVLERWNVSRNPWLRRISVVSLFYYSALRTRHPSYRSALALIASLLGDDHFYVQRGVGWALRELFNVYPERTTRFLFDNAARIPPAGWQAATEKLPPRVKAGLKRARQAGFLAAAGAGRETGKGKLR